MTIPLTVSHQNKKMMLKLPTLKLNMDKDADLKWADAGHRGSLIGPKSRFLGHAGTYLTSNSIGSHSA